MNLDADILHAYIEGTGLVIMANSDNVLRSGLTPKNIDFKELVKCTTFAPTTSEIIKLKPNVKGNEENFEILEKDCKFSVFTQCNNTTIEIDSAEMLFSIDGDVKLTHASGETLTFAKGESVFISAYVEKYIVSCDGKFGRAFS